MFALEYSRLEEKRDSKETYLNFQDLYDRYVQYGGKGTWCSSTEGADCSCDLSCFVLQNCCLDMWQDNRVECREMDGRSTVVITKCPDGFPDKALQYYCERNESDLMTVLDVTPSVDYGIMNTEFKNAFCHICNFPAKIEETIIESLALPHRPIQMKCKQYVDVENYLPSQRHFDKIRNICNIEYKSKSKVGVPSCDIDATTFNKVDRICKDPSVSIYSGTLNSQIKHMCENTGPYIYSRCKRKFVNIFCEMCSLENKECSQTNTSCNAEFETHNAQSCDLPIRSVETDAASDMSGEPLSFELNIPLIKRVGSNDQENSSSLCSEKEYRDKTLVSIYALNLFLLKCYKNEHSFEICHWT